MNDCHNQIVVIYDGQLQFSVMIISYERLVLSVLGIIF